MMVLWRRAAWRLVAFCAVIATAANLGGCPKAGGNGDGNGNGNGNSSGSLTGTWSGNVAYQTSIVVNGQPFGQPFEKPLTVTFDDRWQPGAIDLATANGSDVVSLSTANLVNVGDSDEQAFVIPGGNGTSKTVKVTATVTNISRSQEAFSITLGVRIEFVEAGSMSGTCALSATLQADDTVSWAGTSSLTIDSDKITLPVNGTSSGTLARQ
jgi:hypothetical protein